METNILAAFLLTVLAGLSTGLGGLIGLFIKRSNTTALALGLGFSAGVMIYVSFIEIFQQSQQTLIKTAGNHWGEMLTVIAFFSGITIAALIDELIPESIIHHSVNIDPEQMQKNTDIEILNHRLKRTGIFTAIAIAVHNFPEGLATFMAGLYDVTLGISIAAAIAIHNIPEGISVSLPIYHATGSRKKAFIYSFLSGLAEPLGAIVGFFLLKAIFNDLAFGLLFAAVAGIMVYISFDELLPMAREYGKGHLELAGLVSGMLVMAVSLILF